MKPRFLLISLALLLPSVSPAQAASFYLHATNGATNNWNQTSVWFDDPSGGTSPSSITGQDLFTNGFGLRTTTGNSTFGGATLTLGSSAGDAIQIKNTSGQNSLIANLISLGGGSIQDFTSASFGGPGNPPILTATNFSNLGTTFLDVASNDGRAFKLAIGTLTGAGNLSVVNSSGTATPSTVFLSATNMGTYTGNIVWGDAKSTTLNFDNSFTSGGGLIALSTSRINLDQNVTFTSVTLNGIALEQGTWDYNYLNTNFDTIFTDGGSGSITVVPEPRMGALLGTLAGALLVVRKRSRRN